MTKCQRCGSKEEDLRTLWMACFYEMMELKIPFDQIMIRGRIQRVVDKKKIKFLNLEIPVFKDVPGQKKETKQQFYTLRVCKKCRSEWLGKIKGWFDNIKPEKPSCGTGIFVRKNGTNMEITEEEWNKGNPGKKPVRVKNA